MPNNPCQPSPCGPNSQCKLAKGSAVCSCLPNFTGNPPNCRPECSSNSDCPPDQACQNMKCRDPCPGTCGFNADCSVVKHIPYCQCRPLTTGDPFVRCHEMLTVMKDAHNPCQPSPCGPHSECHVNGDTPSCSCLPDYSGSPPHCRPECVSNSECVPTQACIKKKCRDPCPGLCGQNTICRVFSHTTTCLCLEGFTGDPFVFCNPLPEEPRERVRPCDPNPCGLNARCEERSGAGSCQCIGGYSGNPYEVCKPECVLNTDCASDKVCQNQKCADPCPGTCGDNSECRVINHLPSCNCLPNFTGDPYTYCFVMTKECKNTTIFYNHPH